ncbi:MAG: type IX secretion system membrane protein PorP/SprF [Saprospiraceae bacterium]|nr:type IX secretion system membrane protein PorP/SprF [Saprospiraceae bacterium]
MNKNTLTTLVFIWLSLYVYGQQDPMFTRYMFISDMMYNPASTANNGQTRLMAFYRNQWIGLEGAPVTSGLSVEIPLASIRSGIGLNIFQDKIGFESHTALFANYAYRIPISDKFTLSAGIKGGLSIFRSDFTNAITPDPIQLDPVYNGNDHTIIPRMGCGIFISSDKTYIGMALPYISAIIPDGGFIFAEDDAYLSRHYYMTAGHVLDINGTDLQLKPSVFLKYHASAPLQLDVSCQLWYKDLVSFGLSYRTGDAVAAMMDIGLTKEMVLSYAYDYTYSEFREIGKGAHEIILTYQWKKKNVKIPSIHKFSTLPRF